jgi:hypothetical protein
LHQFHAHKKGDQCQMKWPFFTLIDVIHSLDPMITSQETGAVRTILASQMHRTTQDSYVTVSTRARPVVLHDSLQKLIWLREAPSCRGNGPRRCVNLVLC